MKPKTNTLVPDGGETVQSETNVTEESEFQVKKAVTGAVMGVLVGAVVAFAFANIGGSAVLFGITFLGVSYYLYKRKSSARSAIGSGLYYLALWILVSPIMFYLPIIGGANTDTASGAGQAIGGTLGIVIWGFVGLIIAIVVAGVGYLVNRGVE